ARIMADEEGAATRSGRTAASTSCLIVKKRRTKNKGRMHSGPCFLLIHYDVRGTQPRMTFPPYRAGLPVGESLNTSQWLRCFYVRAKSADYVCPGWIAACLWRMCGSICAGTTSCSAGQ